MNETSKCARWRREAWDCGLLDSLIDPTYFSPPVSQNGVAPLSVVSFHASYPEGRTFERAALGEPWTRVA